MKTIHPVLLCFAAMLSGCATEANFSKALEKPVQAAEAAKLVVLQAERDIEKARAIGWLGSDDNRNAEYLVCAPLKSTAGTLRSLGAFGEALTLIKDVAEQPAGTGYAAYLRQYRKNKGSLRAAAGLSDQELAQRQANEERKAAQAAHDRCLALYRADTQPLNVLAPGSGQAESFATVAALSSLVKGLLAAQESVMREQAVRKTATALIPGLKLAHAQLSASPAAGQPQVAYQGSTDQVAKAMGENLLGATINVRRWFVARQIEQALTRVQGCKTQTTCLGDPLMRVTLDNFANDISSYRQLAAIDTVATLKALKTGIIDAELAATSSGDWTQFLDALGQIYDALSGLDTQYNALQASRD